MTNKTQKSWVKGILLKEGSISRNFALKNYVSRLGAIICLLKKEGLEIEGKNHEGDYVYSLMNHPPRIKYLLDRERNVMVEIHG